MGNRERPVLVAMSEVPKCSSREMHVSMDIQETRERVAREYTRCALFSPQTKPCV